MSFAGRQSALDDDLQRLVRIEAGLAAVFPVLRVTIGKPELDLIVRRRHVFHCGHTHDSLADDHDLLARIAVPCRLCIAGTDDTLVRSVLTSTTRIKELLMSCTPIPNGNSASSASVAPISHSFFAIVQKAGS